MTMDNRTKWIALIVLCAGDLMIVLDTTIVNVALPSIREDLGFSETSLAWVVNAYLLTFGGFLLLGGRLGDLFGHRKLFLIGLVLFTVASLACGVAQSQEFLVAARAIQGLGGAVVAVVALSLVMTLFTEPAERAKAMGVIGFVASGGGSVGVVLGGVLTDALDWHWIFLVNLPIGVAVVVATMRLLPDERGPASDMQLDVGGAVTVTTALMLAVYAIVNGNDNGWTSLQTLGLLAIAAVLFAVVHHDRGALALAAHAARPVPQAQRRRRQRRRRALGRCDVRLVLPLGAVPAARARLQPARGRPRVPARQPRDDVPVGVRVGEARHALRLPCAARGRARGRRGRAAAVRPRAGRRRLHRRRPAGDAPARLRRRHRVQPGAARRDERRRAAGRRPRPRAS